jgi:hypothetical protein
LWQQIAPVGRIETLSVEPGEADARDVAVVAAVVVTAAVLAARSGAAAAAAADDDVPAAELHVGVGEG